MRPSTGSLSPPLRHDRQRSAASRPRFRQAHRRPARRTAVQAAGCLDARRGCRSRSIRGSDDWRRAACRADRPERRSECGRAALAQAAGVRRGAVSAAAAAASRRQASALRRRLSAGACFGPRRRAVSSCANSRNALRSTGLKRRRHFRFAAAPWVGGETARHWRKPARAPSAGRSACGAASAGAAASVFAGHRGRHCRRAAVAPSACCGASGAGLKPIGRSRRARAN